MPNKVIKKTALTPTVLISGGTGFLGARLAETLLEQNARVVVVDLLSKEKVNHAKHLIETPKFALFNADINEAIPAEIHSVDYIFHLAGIEAYLLGSNQISLHSLLTNSLGTKNLLDFAQKCDAKMLLGSSINVYQGMIAGLNLEHYFGRTAWQEKKYSLTEATRYAEALVGEYFKKFDIDVRIARVPEVYGPNMDLTTNTQLTVLLDDVIHDRDLTLFGEGTNKEYYMHVDDVVTGFIKALFSKGTQGKIYSLVADQPFTGLEVVYAVKSIAQKELDIAFKESRLVNEPTPVQPDRSNLESIRWRPQIPLKEGLIETLKSFKYEPNIHPFKPARLITANERESISEQIISIVNPELPVIETTPEPTKLQTHTLTTAGNIYAKPAAIPLKNKLASLYDKLNPLKNVKPETAHNIKFTLSLLTIIIAFTLIFVGLPIVQTSYHVYKAKGQLANLPNTVATFDTKLAEQQANDAYENLDKAQLILSRIKWFANVTGQTERYTIAQKGLGTGKYLARSMYFASKAAEPYTDLWKIVKPTSEEKLDPEKLANSKLYLREANNQLQLAIADYKGLNKAYIPDMYKDKVLEFENKLGRAEKALGLAEELTKELPDLLGVEGKRKYLVLFQNNNEIRPTGGFVGSYATLELEAGKIIKLEIDDVYNPDGQIDIRKIAVNPPAPIKDLLDEQVLHIRNANWNPSFPKSAQTIEDLFFRIDAREFDGVIAIDLYMLQNLLRVTGPVFITAYNEEITADNVYERTQFHSEFNYEEGSNQKRAFLTLLGSKLLETLFGLDKANVPNLLSTVESALNEKHLMIHLNNNSFNATLAKNNWNGTLVTKPGDYLYVVNSNLGGTKANYWVQENMDYKVSSKTRDGLLRAELVLTYTHTGTENKWPNGPYTNYVRVLTKQGAKLTGAQIVTKNRSEELLKKFEEEAAKTTKVNKTDDENDKYIITDEGILIQDVFADIIIAREDTLNSFEQAFTVNPQEIVEFKLEYDLPEQLSVTASNKDYALYWQKQPGTQGDTINFSFEPPFGTSLESVKNMRVVGDTANYTGVLNTDLTFGLRVK